MGPALRSVYRSEAVGRFTSSCSCNGVGPDTCHPRTASHRARLRGFGTVGPNLWISPTAGPGRGRRRCSRDSSSPAVIALRTVRRSRSRDAGRGGRHGWTRIGPGGPRGFPTRFDGRGARRRPGGLRLHHPLSTSGAPAQHRSCRCPRAVAGRLAGRRAAELFTRCRAEWAGRRPAAYYLELSRVGGLVGHRFPLRDGGGAPSRVVASHATTPRPSAPARRDLGHAVLQSSWHRPPITSRSPTRARSIDRPPPRGARGSVAGAEVSTATMGSSNSRQLAGRGGTRRCLAVAVVV